MEHHQTFLPPTSMPVFLPVMRSHSPGHDYPENTTVLDLCVRKRSLSPNYSYECKRSNTSFSEMGCLSPKSDDSDVSSTENNSQVSSTKLRCSRPFKAYPKDPLSLALLGTTHNILGKDSVEAYADFRDKMLSRVQNSQNGTNKNMRRTQSMNIQNSDPTYWEKRKKNNEAAKRSRDARRAKEDEIAIRCAFLEQENIQLKFRLAALENERERFQTIVYH